MIYVKKDGRNEQSMHSFFGIKIEVVYVRSIKSKSCHARKEITRTTDTTSTLESTEISRDSELHILSGIA